MAPNNTRSDFKTTPDADKPQIRLKSKAQTNEKAQSRRRRDEQYVLKRFVPPTAGLLRISPLEADLSAKELWRIKWGFETISGHLLQIQP